MEQILLAYGLLKETATTVIMLHKNRKAMVHSLDRDTDFFDIVTRVLHHIYLRSAKIAYYKSQYI